MKSAPGSSSARAIAASVLEVEDLRVSFPHGRADRVEVVKGVSFSMSRGEALAIVGESGSGKTMTSLSLLGLVPKPGDMRAARLMVDGLDVTALGKREWPAVRGKNIAMVFQDALSGLNPVRTIGSILVEAIRRHQGLSTDEAKELAIKTIAAVGIPEPAARFGVYPHQLSGGLRQRVMIALAIVNRPSIVVADEPTTALDATIQAQILELLQEMVTDAALILVTHDLGVAASICDRVAVMYAGRFVEVGPVDAVLSRPRHPYTAGLLAAVPRFERQRKALIPIPGSPPSPDDVGAGCPFQPRCARAQDRCAVERPPLEVLDGHPVACWNPVPR
ncbi:MAG: ABC transporter ATP-binding protein [Acidimicrobiia bacterium]|nr:ABC transporter ATP-binding protein [Acidimicrobiia bacterium]